MAVDDDELERFVDEYGHDNPYSWTLEHWGTLKYVPQFSVETKYREGKIVYQARSQGIESWNLLELLRLQFPTLIFEWKQAFEDGTEKTNGA